VKAVVLIGANNAFIAGSDIREFGRPIPPPELPDVIAAIEAIEAPVIAAIDGPALGGGFELALGCDYRLATPKALVGLPEITLGMIPGAGGTQRLPRLVKEADAIDIVCSGRRIGASEALSLGLVDAVVEGDLREEAIRFGAAGREKRVLRTFMVRRSSPEALQAAEDAALKKGKGRENVRAAIEAIRWARELPAEDGLACERQVFQRLRNSPAAGALRHLFFAEREAAKVPGMEAVKARPIKTVGVVGAGTMGSNIARAFLDGGFEVVLVDQAQGVLNAAVERMRQDYERTANPGAAAKPLERLTTSTDIGAAAPSDLLVEAVVEDLPVKTAVFKELDRLAPPHALMATNTSYLDVNRIAEATERPEAVFGLHFFHPAHRMKLIEIVRAEQTSAEALKTGLAMAKALRKIPVVARVGEGFIGNRIYAAYRRQCEFMLEEGALPSQVDGALQGFGMATGPFAVSDMSGLDIAWRMRQRLASSRDPLDRYVSIPDQLCELGRFGQKSGAGWYRYGEGSRKPEDDPQVTELIETASRTKGVARRAFSSEEIVERALITMINEAALLLLEGIAQRPSDVDIVMVHGYGFPDVGGGPLYWASRQPTDAILGAMIRLEATAGHGFKRGPVEELLERLKRDELAP
jgi:3-hydroxyacyl-CoA dehydrogenase